MGTSPENITVENSNGAIQPGKRPIFKYFGIKEAGSLAFPRGIVCSLRRIEDDGDE